MLFDSGNVNYASQLTRVALFEACLAHLVSPGDRCNWTHGVML
jgi:hypothetical protein